MHITPNLKKTFHPRIVPLIALSGIIALSACSDDITGPKEATAAPEVKVVNEALASLSSSLDDMTGWSVAAVDDSGPRLTIVGVLAGLKGHLKSGNIALCQQDVTEARGILASLTDAQQVELGPVGVALDVVQQAIGDSQ